MKIELKHLAPYLPYGLKIRCFRKGEKLFLEDIILTGEILDYILSEDANRYNYHKPILRNLSDLTKEIEHNGEKFVPLYELCKTQGFNMLPIGNWEYSYSNEFNCNTSMMKNKAWIFRFIGKDNSFFLNGICEWTEKHQKTRRHIEMAQKLFEWHFDVFGLIPQNLAIDLNTLNP